MSDDEIQGQMPTSRDHLTPDQRLARSRLAADIRLKRIDQALARAQFEHTKQQQKTKPGSWAALFSPTGVVLIGAMLGLVGTAVGKYFDYLNTKRQQETSVILKASEVPASLDAKQQAIQRARNLLWFSQAHYIDLPADFAAQLEKDADLKPGEVLAAPVIDASAATPARPVATCQNSAALTPMFEGFSAKAYPDLESSDGEPWSIGFGHLISPAEKAAGVILIDGKPVHYAAGITPEQGRAILADDMTPVYTAIDRMVTAPLTRQQRDSLASLAWNIGIRNVERSTLLKHVNAGEFDAVPVELARWTKINGKAMKGLEQRRAMEAEIWRCRA